MELTVNNAARKAVSTGVSMIPEAGEVISTLLDALWPEDEADAWDGLKDQAEQLIGQKLSELVYSQATGKLQGLRNVLDDYGQALRDSARHKSYITEKYNVALGAFELLQEDFKTKDYEVTLLPLFAQMVNLHLALLRDGVLNGFKWGWTRAAVWTLSTRLEAESDRYVQWVTTWFKVGYERQPNLPESARHFTMLQWNSHSRYVREMTVQVLDYAYYWPYFSPRKGLAPKPTREIYSDLYGTADVNPIRVTPQSAARLSCINIFAWDWPYRIELSYDPAARPNLQYGPPPHGCAELVSVANPVVRGFGRTGTLVNQLGFEFRDGRRVECGGYPGGFAYDCAVEGHVVSQIYTTGPSRQGDVLESVIYGFRIEESYPTPQEVAADALAYDFANSLTAECYVINPVWHDVDAVVKARHGLGLGAEQGSAMSGGELRWGYGGYGRGLVFYFRGVEMGTFSVKNPHTLEWAHQTGSVDMPFAAQLIFNADFTTLTGTFHFYEGGDPIKVKGQRLASEPPRVDSNYNSADR